MKEIRAFIQPHKLSVVTMALVEIPGFPGMTVMDCNGFGRQSSDYVNDYRLFLPKKRLEIFSPDSLVPIIFETIMRVGHSGQHGDGKVYIIDSNKGGQISTLEVDVDLG